MGAMLAYLTNWEIGTLSGLAVAVVLSFVWRPFDDGRSGIRKRRILPTNCALDSGAAIILGTF